ncbi:MFS transporter [Streptomyces sp. P38-E01]|uniref:MFS transporter n=1 Tax=Streptomyces tardus TaxID=2780544 RepID=A0A949JJU1_9ACTN|nr:MFS transporter [Streptomyces tardus]MBU7600015.1 MFS transporter [Streptomyces tardus]
MPQPEIPGARPPRARTAVGAVFAAHGVASGTFATRIPWIHDRLDVGTGLLGLALACATVGAALAMPLAPRLALRYGPRAGMRLPIVWCFGTLLLPVLAPGLLWLCLALLVLGAGLGLLDVAMNAQGVEVERELGRSVMSGLHGMWSVGTLLGGAVGALTTHLELDGRLHTALVVPVLLAVLLVVNRTPDHRIAEPVEPQPHFVRPPRAVLAIGLVGLCAVFAEGASMDWSGVYLRDVTGSSPTLAAGAYTAFATTMAVARLSGDAVVRRFGAVTTVRAGGVLAVVGAAVVTAARTPSPAVAGFALVGVGIAVVVPLCFAAAGRVGDVPGRSIAGVATLAYASGLAAPALVGWIAEVSSLSFSFGLVAVLACGLVLGAGLLRTAPHTTAASPAASPPADRPRPKAGHGSEGDGRTVAHEGNASD